MRLQPLGHLSGGLGYGERRGQRKGSRRNRGRAQRVIPSRRPFRSYIWATLPEEHFITAKSHFVNGNPLQPPFPAGLEEVVFGLGCFWGAEGKFWQTPGVFTTAAGYAGGFTPNPTYEEVCSGRTGHTEVVRVIFDPKQLSYGQLLAVFFENHDPTQGMRQGGDIGTQYRSAIYATSAAQKAEAEAVRTAYGERLRAAGHGAITTEIRDAPDFYYAEDYHQQYLAKNLGGYCGVGGAGVSCPVGVEVS